MQNIKPLTAKQKRILDYISKSTQDHGYPPTIRELVKQFSLSIGTIQWYLRKLEEQGYLSRKEGMARAIVPSPKRSSIPIVGRIQAGGPALAFHEIEGHIPPSDDLRNTETLFALRVRGDSMVNAGILEGDIAILRQQEYASDGDIVAALLDDETTLKRLKRINGHYALKPENPKYKPITGQEFKIMGKLLKVIRDYK